MRFGRIFAFSLIATVVLVGCSDDDGTVPSLAANTSVLTHDLSNDDLSTGVGELIIGDMSLPFTADACSLVPVRYRAVDYAFYVQGHGGSADDPYEIEVFRSTETTTIPNDIVRLSTQQSEGTSTLTNHDAGGSSGTRLEVSASMLSGEVELLDPDQGEPISATLAVTCG